jgi:hypothetical protein
MRRALIGTVIGLIVGVIAGLELQKNIQSASSSADDRVPRREISAPFDYRGDLTVVIRGTWIRASDRTSAVYPYVKSAHLPWETSLITCSRNELVCKEILASIDRRDGVLRIRDEESPIKSWDRGSIVTEINGPIPTCVTIITRYDLTLKEAVQYVQRKTPQELAELPTPLTENCDLVPQIQEFWLSGGKQSVTPY